MIQRFLRAQTWNPYLAGAVSGVLLILSVLVADKFFGASTSFVRSAGMLENIFAPEHVRQLEYFAEKTPKIDWQWMFVLGIFLGSLLSSRLGGTFRLQALPPMWRSAFGGSILKRAGVAFAGGLIGMFGVRLAGGCPSGHGLSGVSQLSVSGLVALTLFFGIGVLVARKLYRGGRQ
jgi:uncharacterized membrane protein YedE/YeeE